MTPPASEGYWARVWPPHSQEDLALLKEKRVAGKSLHVASFLTPLSTAGWALCCVLSKGCSQHAECPFPKLIRCKSPFPVQISTTAVLAQNNHCQGSASAGDTWKQPGQGREHLCSPGPLGSGRGAHQAQILHLLISGSLTHIQTRSPPSYMAEFVPCI